MAAAGPQQEDEIIADINVTPLVDIILVLLIIFMVTTSVIVTPAIKIELPKAANAEDNPDSTFSLILTKTGKLFLNGEEASTAQLKAFVSDNGKNPSDLQAVISADKDVSHGKVIALIDLIKGLGITQFALNIEQVEYNAWDEAAPADQ